MGYLSDVYFITNQEGYSLIVQDADAQSIVNVANSIEVNMVSNVSANQKFYGPFVGARRTGYSLSIYKAGA